MPAESARSYEEVAAERLRGTAHAADAFFVLLRPFPFPCGLARTCTLRGHVLECAARDAAIIGIGALPAFARCLRPTHARLNAVQFATGVGVVWIWS